MADERDSGEGWKNIAEIPAYERLVQEVDMALSGASPKEAALCILGLAIHAIRFAAENDAHARKIIELNVAHAFETENQAAMH